MKVAIGCDHHGVDVKSRLANLLGQHGHEIRDAGTNTNDPVDYPDVASVVADLVVGGDVDRGILICGSGMGMAIAANKVPGIRAAVCLDTESAEVSRRHNDTNILCLSGDWTDSEANQRIVDAWLTTDFDGGRHRRRVEKISDIETRCHQRESD